MYQFKRHSLTRALSAAFGGASAASLAIGLLTLAPNTAHAQAATGVTFTSVYNFGASVSDGSLPIGALCKDSGGNYYGACYRGGDNNFGTVYKIAPNGTETVLHSFAGGSDGKYPYSGLVKGADGNFYGTTYSGGTGGSSGDGVVYEITPAGVESIVYTFTGTDGTEPLSDLSVGTDGNFYGTCYLGGAHNKGCVYMVTPQGSETTLYSFTGGIDGSGPDLAPILEGSDGNFYGTTLAGGANSQGVVYKLTPSGTETVLHSFGSGTDGEKPYAGLALDSAGDMFGTTTVGGANGNGTVFEISASGTYSTLYSFSATSGNTDGASPYQGVLVGTDGNLYGKTYGGGANGAGTIFSLSPSGTFSLLYTFSTSADGADAFSNVLAEDADGTLYGTSQQGAAHSGGALYKLTVPGLAPAAAPVGSGKRFDFNGDGYADLLWYNHTSGSVSVWNMQDQTVLYTGGAFSTVDPSTGWIPVASPDFSGNRFPGLMWWNRNTGELSLWTMRGTTVTNYGSDFSTVSDTDWMPVAVTDDSDGINYNLVFMNQSTGAVSAWHMHGATPAYYGGTLATLGAGTPWQIVGSADLDGDGKSDLLWWNSSTGEASWWGCDLNDQLVLSYHGDFAQVTDTSWHLVGAEDLDGDGQSDLIWRNAGSGAVSRWRMTGTTVDQYGADLTDVSDLDWRPDAIR